MTLSVGVDVGGTKILVGLVNELGNVVDRRLEPTPADDPGQLISTIVRLIDEVSAGVVPATVGVAFAGMVDSDSSRVLLAPNLSPQQLPLKELLEQGLNRSVIVENDANAAAWGEFQYGASRHTHSSLMVTVGTGVGGGLILGGQVQRGTNGVAAEIGHLVAVPGGRRCPCGNRGCLERYASGSALVGNVRRLLATRASEGAALLDRVHGDIRAVTGQVITRAAQDGDALALQQIALVGTLLGRAIADIVTLLDPEAIVIGGGVAEAGNLLLDPAQDALNAALVRRHDRPEIVLRQAARGNDAGVIGAAHLAGQPGSTDGRRSERHQAGAMARRPARRQAGGLSSVGNAASVLG